jgi:predicted component of viral defense system (DUF524 family)
METLKLWAEQGGLVGMVICSLFAMVALFHHSLTRKDQRIEKFVERMMDRTQDERQVMHKEHSRTYNRLSDALTDLTSELKKNKE